jgi:hypothetical protein
MVMPDTPSSNTPGTRKRKIRVSPTQNKARRLDFSSTSINISTISDPSLSPPSTRSGTDISFASSFDNQDLVLNYINNHPSNHPTNHTDNHSQTDLQGMIPSLPGSSTDTFRGWFRDLHNAGIMTSTIFEHLSTALDLVDLKNQPSL